MDLLSREGFLSKVKWILSSLGGIMLWPSRLESSNMQIPKEYPLHQCLQPAGLKTLVYSSPGERITQNLCHPTFIITSYVISSSSSASSSLTTPSLLGSLTCSASWSSVMDDLIGTESGVYMNSDEPEILQVDKAEASDHYHNLGKRRQRCAMTREYPPPIPLLARTGNLPGHMPWVLTRHYTNGKLILKEERVKHHQYFEAYRENGRLILNLVLLDDTVTSCHAISHEKNINEELELEDLEFIKEEQDEYRERTEADDLDGYFDHRDNITLAEEATHKAGSIMIMDSQMPNKKYLENGFERYGALRTCFTYSGREISKYDANIFCNIANADAHHELGGTYFAHSGSAPLALPVRPMTTVM